MHFKDRSESNSFSYHILDSDVSKGCWCHISKWGNLHDNFKFIGLASDKSWPQSGKLTSDMKILRNGFKSLFCSRLESFYSSTLAERLYRPKIYAITGVEERISIMAIMICGARHFNDRTQTKCCDYVKKIELFK